MKPHNSIAIYIAVVLLISFSQLSGVSTAFGLSPMGPPRSILQQGQGAFSLELGYSEMDLQSFGDVIETRASLLPVTSYTKYKLESLKSTMVAVRLDSNISENWDIFLRLGISDASDDIKEELSDGSVGDLYRGFDGGFGSCWGLGTRATFFKEDNITWGGLFQANWFNPGDSEITNENDTNFSGNAEIDFWEVQMAFGPTITYENVRLYGGPFIHFVNGDLTLNGTTLSDDLIPLNMTVEATHEIREESQIGGFLGAQWKLGDYNTLVTEVQFTSDIWGIGIGTSWKF